MANKSQTGRPPRLVRRRHRRGAAMVEFGLVLPLLITIILGCVDFGRFAARYIAVTNASRTGAAFGSLNPFTTATKSAWETQIRQRVAEDLGVTTATVAVDGTYEVDGTGRKTGLWRVRVQVTLPFATIVSWPGIPNNVNLTQSAEMRGLR